MRLEDLREIAQKQVFNKRLEKESSMRNQA